MNDILDSGIERPLTPLEDRKMLGWSIYQYQHMAQALSNGCFLNRQKQEVKIKNCKLKKLRNIRHTIRKNPLFMQSPIHMELLRRLNIQIGKRVKRPTL